MDRYLIIASRYGERYLFASDRGPWQWDIPKKPEYKHFKLMHPFEARRVLDDIEDEGLLRRIHDIHEGRPNSCLSIALYDVRERLLSHLVELDMNGEPLICIGGGLCVFREERPWPVSPPAPPKRAVARELARLDATDSWVAVECVDGSQEPQPVSGVQLEIITCAGLVYTRSTDAKGVMFLSGIAPGSVTIRVLSMDEGLWRPAEGDAPEATPSDGRPRWHEVARGDTLSKIARRYGVKSGEVLWHYAKNEPLRAKRKSPGDLQVGDQLAIPPTMIGAIKRETEATHRLVLKPDWFEVVVEDQDGAPVAGVPYWYEYLGALRQGSTGDDGSVYVTGVAPGEYTVHFAIEDMRAPESMPRKLGAVALEAQPVSVQIVDDEGNPLSDIECELNFPDQSQIRVRSDAEGWVRAQSPKAGDCELRLVNVDGRLWELAEDGANT